MRNLIQIVSLFFILAGIVALVAVIPALFERAGELGTFPVALGVIITALTPGGAIIIFGSVSYMLCSIDMRLEDMAERQTPRPIDRAVPAMGGREHERRAD